MSVNTIYRMRNRYSNFFGNCRNLQLKTQIPEVKTAKNKQISMGTNRKNRKEVLQ